MKTRRLAVTQAAAKDIRRLPKVPQRAVIVAIEAYAAGNLPNADIVKLKGRRDEWRLRVGSYRIIFRSNHELLILRVLDRKEAYR